VYVFDSVVEFWSKLAVASVYNTQLFSLHWRDIFDVFFLRLPPPPPRKRKNTFYRPYGFIAFEVKLK
jgi:hypothetical protein